MPKAIVEKLRDEFIKASHDPELQRRLGENGTPIVTSTPEEMQALMVSEAATMNELVRTLGIRQQ
jgi:tripartite-type tricarboxylate transporter receptor subunit TctC